MNKFARFYLEKLGRVAWADHAEGMSPENQQRLADSLPANKTRMTGPLGRGAEGTAVKSFTGGGVGPSVTKRFFHSNSGSGTPGNIADKIDLFKQYPQLFPKIHHQTPGGYAMERLTPWPGRPNDSATVRPGNPPTSISPQTPVSPGTPTPSFKSFYDSARPLAASPVPNVGGNTTQGPSVALRGSNGQLFEVGDIRQSNVGIDAKGNTKVFDPQIARISRGEYPMPMSSSLPNATPVIRRLLPAPGQTRDWGYVPGRTPPLSAPPPAAEVPKPPPTAAAQAKPTFAPTLSGLKRAPALGGAIAANLLGGKVVDGLLPAARTGDGYWNQVQNNFRDTQVAMGGGALGGAATNGHRGALVGAIGGGIGDLTNKALTLGKDIRDTHWKSLGRSALGVNNPELETAQRRVKNENFAKYKENNLLPQSSNPGDSSFYSKNGPGLSLGK